MSWKMGEPKRIVRISPFMYEIHKFGFGGGRGVYIPLIVVKMYKVQKKVTGFHV